MKYFVKKEELEPINFDRNVQTALKNSCLIKQFHQIVEAMTILFFVFDEYKEAHVRLYHQQKIKVKALEKICLERILK